MRHFVYILQSEKDGKYYIGNSGDVAERLEKHNNGGVIATRHRRPLKVIYKEELPSKLDAIRRERKIKSYKGGSAFKKLIQITKQ